MDKGSAAAAAEIVINFRCNCPPHTLSATK